MLLVALFRFTNLRVLGAQVDGADEIAHVFYRPRSHGRLVGRVRTGLPVGRGRGCGGHRSSGAGRSAGHGPAGGRLVTRQLFRRLCRFRRHAAQPLAAAAAVGERDLFPRLLQRHAERRHVEERFGERAGRSGGGCCCGCRGRAVPVADRGRHPLARLLAHARRRRRQVERILFGRRRRAAVVRRRVLLVGRRRRRRGTGPLRAGLAAHERVELRRPDHGQQRLRGRHVHHRREHGHIGARYGGRREREPGAQQATAAALVVVFRRRRRGRQQAQVQPVPRRHYVPIYTHAINIII